MKRILLFSSIILLHFTTIQAQDWQKFKDDSLGVQIKFPQEYKRTVSAVEDRTTYQIRAYGEGIDMYYLNVTFHNIPLDDAKELAKVSLDAFSNELGGKLEKTEEYNGKGYTGYRAWIDLLDKGAEVHYIVAISGQRQIQIVATHDDVVQDTKVTTKFMKSLKIKTPKPTK